MTPSDIFNGQGPTELLKASSERIAAEQKWYALTGGVIEVLGTAKFGLAIVAQSPA